YLAAKNYVPDEGHFAFVLIVKEAIEITTFNRSQKLDVLAKQDVGSRAELDLDKSCRLTACAVTGSKTLWQHLRYRGRNFMLG
ncbi:hypothetical protein ACC728_38560, partial [Rhizobium ruizarguesonis]